jgi:carbon-monoxide dehydrogenase catalytic subunit
MRRGIAMAGNHLMTELILSTGAVDMMLVDYQCIMPSLGKVAACYHTKMISTSDKAQFPHMEHHEFHPDNAEKKAVEVVARRLRTSPTGQGPHPGGAPGGGGRLFGGDHRGGAGRDPEPLIDAIKAGKIRGAPWASWGATTPRSSTTTAT